MVNELASKTARNTKEIGLAHLNRFEKSRELRNEIICTEAAIEISMRQV